MFEYCDVFGEGFIGNVDVFDMVFEGLFYDVFLEWFE